MIVDSISSIGIYVKNLFDKLNDNLMKDLKIKLNKWFAPGDLSALIMIVYDHVLFWDPFIYIG